MFSTLDNLCISIAQWIIRQIELFTPLTRKSFFVFVYLWSWMSLVLSIIFYSCVGFIVPSFLISIICIVRVLVRFFWVVRMRVLMEISFRSQASLLPKEIYLRSKYRSRCWFGVFFIAPLVAVGWFLLSKQQGETLLVQMLITVLSSTPLLPEYFLCTKSLPLGEKAKIKQERELRGMKTAPVGV